VAQHSGSGIDTGLLEPYGTLALEHKRQPDRLVVWHFELMYFWTFEVRHHLVSGSSEPDDLLKKLGWPGLQGWLVLSEDGNGTLNVR
jgi:hypothetical protein